ncbi:MAG: hypothetical protein MUC95_07685 [Spirochaetes bacterium]|nr:hypothetical protein [Spirochaetota bacterium]
MFLKKMRILILLILCSFILTCSGEDEKDKIKVYITGLGSSTISGDFNGHYIVDAGSRQEFAGEEGDVGNFYKDINLGDSAEYVKVHAHKYQNDASLSIDIWRDTKSVKSITLDANKLQSGSTTQYQNDLELDYEYGEEDQSTTTDDDDDTDTTAK